MAGVIGVEGTINPEGYLNSIAFYEAHKGLSFGAGIGVPFNWDGHDVGEIVRINGSAGDLLDAIQVHFAGGQSTPYIGGDEGEEFDIDFSEDPLSQITFRAVDHGTLLSVEFIKESGESLRVGDKTDSQVNNEKYEEFTLSMRGKSVVAMYGTTLYEKGQINNLGFDLV